MIRCQTFCFFPLFIQETWKWEHFALQQSIGAEKENTEKLHLKKNHGYVVSELPC